MNENTATNETAKAPATEAVPTPTAPVAVADTAEDTSAKTIADLEARLSSANTWNTIGWFIAGVSTVAAIAFGVRCFCGSDDNDAE